MKITFLPILLGELLAGSLAACNEESAKLPLEQPAFFVKAQKNDTAWSATTSGTYVKSTGAFLLFGHDTLAQTPSYLRLGFTLPKGKQQLSAVQPLPAEWDVLLGGDARIDYYSSAAAETAPKLEITRLDTVKKIVEGRFSATLRRDAQYTKQVELLRFTEGSFRVQYQEVEQ
ncbi:hypothetical protein DNI29_01330 [Hymenobacter sediminis]|uniref:hypothetical protein n=1 Tax=Hymenobacter sediminis TaxID=2218621 RepID=UPI000DA6B64A|nr:hypothetical protein [Hymenobacter sediminis]RPD49474.1 hypothetical protein DNI29_01330 [Hymenobacter sediminis]